MLNRNWQAIHIRTPAEAFCQMAANAAIALDIELDDGGCVLALSPVKWDKWITLPVCEGDHAVRTPRGHGLQISLCKCAEQAENHKIGSLRSWATKSNENCQI